jgi:uncharacterized phage protein gp47/JayE
MAISLRELFTPKTKDEILASILSVAQQIGLPITAWQPLEPAREIFEIISQVMSMYTEEGFRAASSKLLTYATGQWLTLTTSEDWGTDRIPSTFATGTELLTNTTFVSIPIAAGDLHFLNTTSGKTYTNTSAGTLVGWSGVGDYPTLELSITADEPGSGSNAAIGEINSMIVSNTTTFVGNDEESDENLRTRAREGNARLSPNGPRDAYSYFAKSTTRTDGSNVGVTRVKVYQPYSNRGFVSVYLASESGAVTGANNDFTTDVGLVQKNLLENVVPTGFIVSAVSAVPLGILIQATVYLKASSTAQIAQVNAAVLESLADYFSEIPIGGIELVQGMGGQVFLSAIVDAIFNAAPEDIVQATILNYTSDIPLALNNVPTLASTAADINVVYATS